MTRIRIRVLVTVLVLLLAHSVFAGGRPEGPTATPTAATEEFSWRRFEGDRIHFLANNNPIGQLLQRYAPEFTALTGINVEVSLYAEQQYRQRLETTFQARSDEVDVFMSLVSREGSLYDQAGWYADLKPFVDNPAVTSPDYDFADFGQGVIDAGTLRDRLTGIPVNIEGPVLYYRADVLEACGIPVPGTLAELRQAAERVKTCRPDMIPFASRGLAPAVPYTFSNFLHNMGGQYVDAQGRSSLSSDASVRAIELYAELLRDFGPPGVINYSFPQLTAVNSNGQAVMTFQSSNEFGKIMEVAERANDTRIKVLPAGPAGSVPVVIGWQLSMSPNSRKQEQAWYFLQWATSRAMQVKLGLDGLAPPRTSVWESQEFTAWLDEVAVRREWAEALSILSETGSSVLAPQIILQPESRQIIGEAVGSVILGEATARQAAARADQLINDLIQRSERLQ
ncbi:MAG: extracellular solute-binding protein [Spirochaetaceae bacterium]|nr:MAG: extracellular solute-binding protein [Spirochaetaceae bacterium]